MQDSPKGDNQLEEEIWTKQHQTPNTKHKLTNFGPKKNSQKTLQKPKTTTKPTPSFCSKTFPHLRHLASAWPIAVGVVSSRPLPRRCIRWVPGYAGAGAGDLRALWREAWRWSSRPVFYQKTELSSPLHVFSVVERMMILFLFSSKLSQVWLEIGSIVSLRVFLWAQGIRFFKLNLWREKHIFSIWGFK